MNAQVETLPHCITTLRVELPAETVTQAFDSITREFTQIAKIPGYRPGKAPRPVVEKKFRKEIREEVEKKLVSESCRKAIDEKKLRVLSIAEVTDIEIAVDKTMRFTATLVTAPDFELPEYKQIPVQQKPTEVTEEDVNQWMENVRDQAADFVDVPERGLQMEDYAVIDYKGTIDGKPVEELFPKAGKPLSGNDDFWIRMTPDAFFPGFCEKLLGAKVGDARDIEIEVPAEFRVKEMAGQKILFAATVKGIKQKSLPEVNDEFASKVVQGKTLAELRELAKQELGNQKERDNEREKRNQVMTYLLSKVECELPQGMVHSETRRILADIVRENQLRGITDDVLKESEKEIVGAASQGARDRVRGSFILLRIAEAEKMTVTKEEFEQRIAALSARYGMKREKLIADLDKHNALEQIREEILTGKVLDFLSANATVQTVPA